jgi:dienelactone hydrolase
MAINKKQILVLLLFCNYLILNAQNQKEHFVNKGKHILQLFLDSKFDSLNLEFNEVQRSFNSAAAIASNYTPKITQYGSIKSFRLGGFSARGAQVVVEFICKTEYNIDLLFQLNFINPAEKLTFFTIFETFRTYALPNYADAELYNEEDVTFAADTNMPIRGILSVPVNKQKLPLVIIVPEAGPTDMDGIFVSKPYKDIASGLSSNGIAVFRYNKRSVSYGFSISQSKTEGQKFTPEEDVLFDLYAAIATLKQNPLIDTNKIYLLGHGEGAYLAPYVAANNLNIKGIIMMGANANHPLEMIQDQNEYLVKILPHKAHDFEETKEHSRIVLKRKVKTNTSNLLLPFHLPPSYWLWINDYNQVKVAKKLSIPIFITQGGRDYQTDKKNFFVWQRKLKKNKNVSFKLYEKMNHIMHEGEGESTYSEYSIMRHIPFEVIDDMVKWLQVN